MKYTEALYSLLFILLLSGCRSYNADSQNKNFEGNHLFPQHVDYSQASFINQFSQSELDEHVTSFYDIWKNNYLIHAGQDKDNLDLYRIVTSKPGETTDRITVSEGQGYGMILSVLMAGHDPLAQKQFDGLWLYAKSNPSQLNSAFMSWRISTAYPSGDSAFDGDADIAYALLLADKQWGSDGPIDYLGQSVALINAIKLSVIDSFSHLPYLGDFQVRNPDKFLVRPSDFLLTNFRAYHAATKDPFWLDVIQASLNVMQKTQSRYSEKTGLISDFMDVNPVLSTYTPASGKVLESEYDGMFYYNACRVPMRIGLDALLTGNEKSSAIVKQISQWISPSTNQNPENIKAGYHLDGQPIAEGNYFTTVFAAPLGVAAMTVAGQGNWLDSIYNEVYQLHESYFEDTINLLSMLIMSRNYWTY